ncbi:unnamed protein product [Lepeophtheirus salmonis]|uniref:(salmon louse) hypothetical protein n=1 Tax=Lepeophtheirus salmonis TaxID=72036 RepID=A0A7R8CD29_LEPSM|nr:unnamed protein product [Lepeophtheirus salmonis]CAF2772353.1 unnamed protein product [Lepeophtheirus salmonis]
MNTVSYPSSSAFALRALDEEVSTPLRLSTFFLSQQEEDEDELRQESDKAGSKGLLFGAMIGPVPALKVSPPSTDEEGLTASRSISFTQYELYLCLQILSPTTRSEVL